MVTDADETEIKRDKLMMKMLWLLAVTKSRLIVEMKNWRIQR